MLPEDVEWSLHNSLEMLGLEHVDQYLLHWPFVAEKNEDNTPKLGTDGKVCTCLWTKCVAASTNGRTSTSSIKN